MPSFSPSAANDHALATLIADGAASARLASAVQQHPDATPADRAMAHAISALYALREGTVAQGLAELARAEALLAQAEVRAHGPAEAQAPATPEAGPLPRVPALLAHVAAQWHRREGRLAEAAALLQPLQAQARQRPAVDAYLTASSLGTVVSMQGDDDTALNLFYQALALARRSGERSLIVNALNNLGSYQADLYNLDDAALLLEECLAGALALGSRRQIIYAAGNLMCCLCLRGDAAQALAVAREHLLGTIRADDPPALQRDEELARALLDNGLVDEADAMLRGEIQVDPLSNETATARVVLNARILLARGQAAEALAVCLARRTLLREQGEDGTPPIDRVSLLRVAAEAAHQVGEAGLAYDLLAQAFSTHEQLLGRAARSRQLSLQITHRLQQAEWERDAAQQMSARLAALNAELQLQVQENDRLQQQLRAQALEDPLTGAHNRRHLLDAGSAMLSLMRRRQEPLALAMVDLDHFKRVNDQHGHEAGDRVLQAFAELARRNSRAEDLVCRYGGEEFVLLLAGADAEQAAARLAELLEAFCLLSFEGASGDPFQCSFSAGVTASGPGAASLQKMLSQADAALYIAKHQGRARVQLASTAQARAH